MTNEEKLSISKHAKVFVLAEGYDRSADTEMWLNIVMEISMMPLMAT
jgi:hypothetical protein